MMDRVDRLLGKECYIIDYLPMTVEREGKGQFFEVEEYLLGSEGYRGIRRRFGAVILKLMCYFHVWVFLGEWIDRPSPELVERGVEGLGEGSASEGQGESGVPGTLNVLFPEEDMVLVLDRDSLTMSVYHPPERVRPLLERIAWSEGLFWREGRTD